jgi:hypothetical protein
MGAAPMSADMLAEGCGFTVTLTGSAEKPNPGDPDGAGTVGVLVIPTKNTICYDFKVEKITLPAAAAHIHKAAPDAAGPVVVPFASAPGADGTSRGCVINVPADIISGILTTPADYYVNVHTSDFGGGAIRGQLAK